MKTMLELVQDACGELGLDVPDSVAGNSAKDVVQCLALLNATGAELLREYDWQALTKEYRFTTAYLTTTGTWTTSAATVTGIPTTASLAANLWMASGAGIPQDTYVQSVDSSSQVTLTQTPTAAGTAASITFAKTKYAFPSDYDRLVDRTQWDKTKHWNVLGPDSGQQWQWLKSGYIASGPRIRFRPLGGYFQIWPPLSSNEYLGFEYVSTQWVTDANAAGKTGFTADTDTCAFPDRLMILALKRKYLQVKGFAAVFDADYRMQLDIAKGSDGGSATLSMNPQQSEMLISEDNLPDTGFGS